MNWDGKRLVCSDTSGSYSKRSPQPCGPACWHREPQTSIGGRARKFLWPPLVSAIFKAQRSTLPSWEGAGAIQYWVVTGPQVPPLVWKFRKGMAQGTCAQIIPKAPIYYMKDHEVSCFKCLYYKGFTHLNLEIHIFKRISIQILMHYEFMILYVKFLQLSGCSKTEFWNISFLGHVLEKRYIVWEMACYFDSHLIKENDIIIGVFENWKCSVNSPSTEFLKLCYINV